ncbi:hypothetical protein [Bradyrhizobium sp. Ai1a-2]|uniref:hypothetical protein n=1 Tax=Bradyrhizobium sp. Ai1a-2 TaxID=196490 RepID=UPI00041FB3DA|nr:hypothetical protein [Bradyrhizobium sp. Ai1a-2]
MAQQIALAACGYRRDHPALAGNFQTHRDGAMNDYAFACVMAFVGAFLILSYLV